MAQRIQVALKAGPLTESELKTRVEGFRGCSGPIAAENLRGEGLVAVGWSDDGLYFRTYGLTERGRRALRYFPDDREWQRSLR